MLITLIKLVTHLKLKVTIFLKLSLVVLCHMLSIMEVQGKIDSSNKPPLYSAQASCRKPCRCLASPARGLCEKPYKGEYWCYVDPEACCIKKVRSKRHKNLYWSTEPCNGVEINDINDLEERITDKGNVRCTQDSDCPSETLLRRSVCRSPTDLEGKRPNSGEQRFCYPLGGENTGRTSSIWDFCSNPCNTSTCYITPNVYKAEECSGCHSPVNLSSVSGVGSSSLGGQLFSTSGCPSRTMPCRCRGDPSRCCAPLWGGRSRGIYCPF